ncbi:MAG: hypothetical protein Salg2KO_16230 [Salibacteraceae bacterium]
MDLNHFSVVVNEDQYTRYFTIVDQEKTLVVWKKRDYEWYKTNRVLVTRGGQGGRLLHGEYKEHHLNKNLKSRGKFRKGMRKGMWLNWYENGIIESKCRYWFGFKWGREFKYDNLGNLILITPYRKGKKVRWTRHYRDKRLVSKERYKRGLFMEKIEVVTKNIITEEDIPIDTLSKDEAIKPKKRKEAIRKERRRLKELIKRNPKSMHEKTEESDEDSAE